MCVEYSPLGRDCYRDVIRSGAAGPARNLLLCGLLSLGWGFIEDVFTCVGLYRLQYDYLFYHGLSRVLQSSLCSGIWSSSSNSFSTNLNVRRAVSVTAVPPFTVDGQQFLGKHVFPKTSSLGGSAVACGESVGAGCVQQRSPDLFSFRHLLTAFR